MWDVTLVQIDQGGKANSAIAIEGRSADRAAGRVETSGRPPSARGAIRGTSGPGPEAGSALGTDDRSRGIGRGSPYLSAGVRFIS